MIKSNNYVGNYIDGNQNALWNNNSIVPCAGIIVEDPFSKV
jgi:hypothetical protein